MSVQCSGWATRTVTLPGGVDLVSPLLVSSFREVLWVLDIDLGLRKCKKLIIMRGWPFIPGHIHIMIILFALEESDPSLGRTVTWYLIGVQMQGGNPPDEHA